ncbi:MAG TPA: tetratricopeptide repeat protein [Chthoniobacterales bacterium]|nr:tetratricopeptide repeat protein [Chthoniobacterales bacterium]
MSLKTFYACAFLFGAAAIALATLAWKCRQDPAINFLPSYPHAEWIIFPAAVSAGSHPVTVMDATFRRAFELETQPISVRLQLRAAKRVDLKINGRSVEIGEIRNWKNVSTMDVLGFLQTGANTIEARVFNDDAPPALWLAINGDQFTLRSDQTWEASLGGSAWRRVALASVPRRPGRGNPLAGGETTVGIFSRVWRPWATFLFVALLIAIAAQLWKGRVAARPGGASAEFSAKQVVVLLGICIIAWIILFWNNASMLPFQSGYDSNDHLNYIKYIQERHALPLPHEGFEMFQPPLYYVLSAVALSIGRLSISDGGAVVILRTLTMVFGIVNFTLIFLSLKLIFPERIGSQVAGLLLAAFLPMQLYLSHYVTNETLAATLVTASVYLSLRVLKKQDASVSEYLWLGCLTGAAMLAKATSILLVPPLVGALAIKLAWQRASIGVWLRSIGTTVVVGFVVCGWHYIRILGRFGTPIVGNWDPAVGFAWWQDPGFHTGGDYFRFGRSLIDPLFSGFNGFADGVYSTLWGDSLCGGFSDLLSRTPWNYNLMIGGYFVALFPTLLIATGAGVAVYRFVRQPTPEWFLLLGISAAVMLALVFMTLRVASYAQVKAFYALSALLPLCAFGAAGWEKLASQQKTLRFMCGTLLIFWALNSLASTWIRSSALQHIYAGRRLLSQNQPERAVSEVTQAVKHEPSNAIARYFFAIFLDATGESDKALEQAEKAVQLDSTSGDCHLQLAIALAKRGQTERAIAEGRRALELGPENSRVYDLLFTYAWGLHRPEEAITIARDALAVSPFDSELHYRLGLAADQTGDLVTAVNQFAYASLLQPNRADVAGKLQRAIVFASTSSHASQQFAAIASSAPDSAVLLNKVAWLFATHPNPALRNGVEAVRLAERACKLTNRKAANFVATLAAAYAEAGEFSNAIATAQEALSLAKSTGDASNVALSQDLLASFQANRPYREQSSH